MTIEKFVNEQCEAFSNLDLPSLKEEADFWLQAFVRLVRERANAIVRSTLQSDPDAEMTGVAFNEIVRELHLEEPEP